MNYSRQNAVSLSKSGLGSEITGYDDMALCMPGGGRGVFCLRREFRKLPLQVLEISTLT